MTYEEARDMLKAGIAVTDCEKKRDLYETVLKAVEKQIAKMPIKDEYNFNYCPNCGGDDDFLMYDSNIEDRYNYCHGCGQALDWSGV